MDFTHFLRLIHAESERLVKHYPCDNMDRETFARAVKFADVIITSLLLAERMNIDIESALTKKMEKIEKRYE
ncbi:hypothetical protein AUJ69_00635 [Candidatus Woesearchaeota archaeon CG1_02_47_18]|nr:MAG: hypothetical protein AUJ69_00635 [Candidatus Woesearchaeota archaeon CG1_02_47_18]